MLLKPPRPDLARRTALLTRLAAVAGSGCDARPPAPDFAQRRGLPFGVVIDPGGAIAGAFRDLQATPTTSLIDKCGATVRRYVGEPDFPAVHALVETLLAENPAPA